MKRTTPSQVLVMMKYSLLAWATSPAVETEWPLESLIFSPFITNPPVPLEIAERSIAVLSVA
jgi:hypothetical protein